MFETRPNNQAVELQSRPLCSSYALVIHERLTVQLLDGDLVRNEDVRWALGALADGSYDVLGAWAAPATGSWSWQHAAEDLKARGVERMGLVFAFRAEQPTAIPRRRVRLFRASEEIMLRLQRRASHAVKRRGPCSDIVDATALVENVLRRAERGIGASSLWGAGGREPVGEGSSRDLTWQATARVCGL
jgi:hypothetical protein